MKSIADLIEETPGCSVVPWPFEPSLRSIPEFVPPDIRALSEEFYQIHIFEEKTELGVKTTRGSIQFYPEFGYSVGDSVFLDHSDREDPKRMGFLSCYTLAYLLCGNDQIILDVSGPKPLIRHFYYYSVEPLETYPILNMEFSEFIRTCIASGPEVDFYESLVWNETKTVANKPAHPTSGNVEI